MKVFKVAVWSLLVFVGATVSAGQLRIEAFDPGIPELVFKTADAGTVHHAYRVEAATSLVSGVWSPQRTVIGVGADVSVTSPVTMSGDSMFYRVVSTSNSAVFVDGPYMAIDISGGTNAVSYPVTYYQTHSDVPGGANSDTYKTTHILFRLIPKGTFTMGSPSGEFGRGTDETLHQVTLTKDFYIGVFEVTQRQWELVMGNKPSYFKNATYYASRPVEQVSYYEIRENPEPIISDYWKGSAIAPNWPQTDAIHVDSFMGKLRAKTGFSTFDLPTESQWEYACRAGTTTALNTGYNLTSTSSDPRMDVAGRYWYNGGSSYSQICATSAGTAKAGTYLPNAWGLYDMHGNVWEWCLDWYGTYPGTVTDPLGSASGSFRVGRSGSWDVRNAYYGRSALRYYYYPDSRFYNIGFRPVRTL